jgi:hypothetical protein
LNFKHATHRAICNNIHLADMKKRLSSPVFDIITVCLNAIDSLPLTIASIRRVGRISNVNWIVIDGGSTDGSIELVRNSGIAKLRHIIGPDRGIYDAMNKGLCYVSGDYFLLLNSGDVLNNFNYDFIDGKVNCFQTKWHSLSGESVKKRTFYFPYVGIMMPHQGMLFPSRFRHHKYNTNLKIAADLELKLLLWRSNEICLRKEHLVSSLTGGVSQTNLTWRQYIRRITENYLAMQMSLPFLWRVLATMVIALRASLRLKFRD